MLYHSIIIAMFQIFLGLFTFLSFVFSAFFPAVSQAAFGLSPFGGRVITTIPLVVPPCVGTLIVVNLPRPATLYFPSGLLYSHYSPFTPGNSVLGMRTPVNICGGFPFTIMGTSGTP